MHSTHSHLYAATPPSEERTVRTNGMAPSGSSDSATSFGASTEGNSPSTTTMTTTAAVTVTTTTPPTPTTVDEATRTVTTNNSTTSELPLFVYPWEATGGEMPDAITDMMMTEKRIWRGPLQTDGGEPLIRPHKRKIPSPLLIDGFPGCPVSVPLPTELLQNRGSPKSTSPSHSPPTSMTTPPATRIASVTTTTTTTPPVAESVRAPLSVQSSGAQKARPAEVTQKAKHAQTSAQRLRHSLEELEEEEAEKESETRSKEDSDNEDQVEDVNEIDDEGSAADEQEGEGEGEVEEDEPTSERSSRLRKRRKVSAPEVRLTWAQMIENVLTKHGGEGTMTDIYKWIEEDYPDEIVNKKTWKNTVGSTLSLQKRLFGARNRGGKRSVWRVLKKGQEEEDEEDGKINTWGGRLEKVLKDHGGEGTITDIYGWIAESFPEEIVGKKTWKNTVGSQLSLHRNIIKKDDKAGRGAVWMWKEGGKKRQRRSTSRSERRAKLDQEEMEDEEEEENGSGHEDRSSSKRKRESRNTWVEKVEQVMRKRGGQGTVSDIYRWFEEDFSAFIANRKTWKNTVGSTLSLRKDRFVRLKKSEEKRSKPSDEKSKAEMERRKKGAIWMLKEMAVSEGREFEESNKEKEIDEDEEEEEEEEEHLSSAKPGSATPSVDRRYSNRRITRSASRRSRTSGTTTTTTVTTPKRSTTSAATTTKKLEDKGSPGEEAAKNKNKRQDSATTTTKEDDRDDVAPEEDWEDDYIE